MADLRRFGVTVNARLECWSVKPDNAMMAPQMLKYLNIIRNISERGGIWRGYDEWFRTLKRSEGWAWDCMNYE